MRRHVKRISDIARVTGIVLLCICVVLTIYVTASVGKGWAKFNEMPGLTRQGRLNILDRINFDGEYYAALSRAVAEKKLPAQERVEHLRPCFADFEARARAGAEAEARDALEADKAWFAEGFDVQTFMDFHAAHGDDDSRAISEIIEYLDSLTMAKGKGKAAKLKPASVAPYFEDAYAARGDDSVSYLEFLIAVRSMIEADVEGGITFKDAKAWHAEHFTEEGYAAALEAVQTAERTGSLSLPDTLAEALSSGTDARTAMEAIWQDVKAEFPDADERGFYAAMRTLLFDENYDGSAKSAVRVAEETRAAAEAQGLDAFMGEWTTSLVAEADDRALVGLVGGFWWVVSKFAALWIIGAALVVLGIAMDKLLARHMLRHIDHAGIDEDKDVLLRVEHLCQYFRGEGGFGSTGRK